MASILANSPGEFREQAGGIRPGWVRFRRVILGVPLGDISIPLGVTRLGRRRDENLPRWGRGEITASGGEHHCEKANQDGEAHGLLRLRK